MKVSHIAGKIGLGALAATALLAAAPGASAQTQQSFLVGHGGLKGTSPEHCFAGLCAYVVVNRVNVNGDKNEICAFLRNNRAADWSGGFRLTQRMDPTTHMSLSVGAGQGVRRCEILPRDTLYWIVLRQDD